MFEDISTASAPGRPSPLVTPLSNAAAHRRGRVDPVPYDRPIVGKNLRRLRQARGLTQVEVAEAAGITQAAVSNYEQGKRELPLPTLIVLCHLLEAAAHELIPSLAWDGAQQVLSRESRHELPTEAA